MGTLNHSRILLTAMLVVSMPFIQDCEDPEAHPYPYEWIVSGSQLTYDLHSSTSVVANARTMEVTVGPGERPTMIFTEHSTGQLNDPYKNRLLLGMFSKVLAKPDGLYTTTCSSCNIGACFRSKHYLKVPLEPEMLQKLPEYRCGESIAGYEVVISIDSTVQVPVGEFETIVILDTLTQTVKFWNEKAGLVRVDNFSQGVSDTVKLLLAARNY